MKSIFLLTALSFSAFTSALSADETLSQLVFSDQTTISGTVNEVNIKAETLQFTSPFLKGENQLKTNSLLDLQLNLEAEPPESDHHALATIAPHYDHPMQDTIRGLLVGVDNESVILDTWYAGQLKLKRAMIRGLDIYANSPSLYHGPKGLEDWVTSGNKLEDEWTYKKGSLISKGNYSIAREIEMGERSKLSFRVQWRTNPQFRITFLASSGKQNYPSKGYSLGLARTYLTLNRRGAGRDRNDLFSKSMQEFRSQESAAFEIYLNRSPEGKSALVVDGKLITEWDGIDDQKDMGKWLVFGTQGSSPIKVSKISVSLWDGRVPSSPDTDEAAEGIFEGMEGQRIDLANGDALFGEITGVKEGQTAIKTSLGNVVIPVGRLRSFELHKEGDENLEEPRRWPGEVRAWFTDGGYVTLRLNSLTDKKISGFSQVFGDAEFDLSAFSHIEFNIWDEELNEERSGNDSDW
ncbi:hypothetical protein N9268_01860 [Akkermansiaceae bacterium]|nr:hypothetical protein [bacterium]MDB4421700.1 hypothetical protein [Akkermansiaceae bacterium]MDB4509273.1 hypothetical protein [Akkermansiaceae bacterium]MDB4545476.1 hypothetical protein [Akkermansiaceae bacterium]